MRTCDLFACFSWAVEMALLLPDFGGLIFRFFPQHTWVMLIGPEFENLCVNMLHGVASCIYRHQFSYWHIWDNCSEGPKFQFFNSSEWLTSLIEHVSAKGQILYWSFLFFFFLKSQSRKRCWLSPGPRWVMKCAAPCRCPSSDLGGPRTRSQYGAARTVGVRARICVQQAAGSELAGPGLWTRRAAGEVWCLRPQTSSDATVLGISI